MHITHHQLLSTSTDPATSAVSPVGRRPSWVRIGRGTYPFSSYAAVSGAYRAMIERLDLGVSETPACVVLDEAGAALATVAYNGRVFALGLDGEPDYGCVLHEPDA